MSELAPLQSDSDASSRSLAGWWVRLADGSWRLFLYHIKFLPFVFPVYLGLILFILFHAWAPLLGALVLLFPAGSAFLSMFVAAGAIADGTPWQNLPRFFTVYKRLWREGLMLSLVLIAVVVFTLCPVYFAFVIASAMRFLISVSAAIALLMFFSILPYAVQLLLTGVRRGLVRQAVALALGHVKTSIVLGILQLACTLFAMLSPYISAFAMLLGMPAIITFSIVYFIPKRDLLHGGNSYEPEE